MTAVPVEFPLHAHATEALARIRSTLLDAGFNAPRLCQELKIDSLCQLGQVRWKESALADCRESLRPWMGLFLFGERVARTAVEPFVGPEVLEPFFTAGLLQVSKLYPDRFVSPVFLYPVGEFLIASDRHDDPEGVIDTPRDAQPDVVFPGIFGGTLRFLELLPGTNGGDALDLCGGCGIGALLLAQTARTAVSADITPRATRFAEFNARLNGCGNFLAACGDLYEPVKDRQFDCITAHPPYVPALGSTMIYRDGGDAGEDITRGIVAGLATHLRPGGNAFLLCQGRDAAEGPFEARVRAWLGQAGSDFDVLFALQATKTIEQEVQDMSRRVHPPTAAERAELLARFAKLGTTQFVYGALSVHRHAAGETVPWTERTRLSAETTGRDFEPLVAWHHRQQRPGFRQWLAHAPLRLSPHFEVHVRHVVKSDELVPAEVLFQTERPFSRAMRIDGWVPPLLARFNGRVTPQQAYAEARANSELPAGFEIKDCLDLLAVLVARGYLTPPAESTLEIDRG